MIALSIPENYNTVRECSRRMTKTFLDLMKSVLRFVKYMLK